MAYSHQHIYYTQYFVYCDIFTFSIIRVPQDGQGLEFHGKATSVTLR